MIDRRHLLAAAGSALATPAFGKVGGGRFPKGFLWGAATAGHQVEGNNVNADSWVLESVKPTIYAEPSGDAANSFVLWATDLDLARDMGLNSYRFSLEWARIEPAPGLWSIAMLDHYKAIIAGCRMRGLTPIVTFNHFTTPRWFAAAGGWTQADAPQLFARFCDRAARHLATDIGYATTLNEPNIVAVIAEIVPPKVLGFQRAMLGAAAQACGSKRFSAANAMDFSDYPAATRNMLAGHRAGRAAIKAVRGDLPVGVSLSMFDDQAAGPGSVRDAMRAKLYGPWLDAVRGDDFLGVQNYERKIWGASGALPPTPGATLNANGVEVYAPSLAGAVRYAHAAAGVPIMVTEHGVATDDDVVRQRLIPAALRDLQGAMAEGVPVLGYVHWSLIDNYEWVSGFKTHMGLHAVDRTSFRRTPKPSAAVLGRIARANAV